MIDPQGLVEKVIGYIYSEDGLYEPDTITFTVTSGERVEIGDIVCIKHPSKNTLIFYQVTEVPMRRKARDYEEDLARIGRPLLDETRNYPRARAVQIGYVEDLEDLMKGETSIDDLVMLIEHIKPLSRVYRPKPEVIDKLLQPKGDSIVVGKIYPGWKHEYRFSLPRLLRQGLLVVGGVGTGKTTTMITILYRVIKAFLDKGAKPHVLIIDKDGEYGADKLIKLVGEENYVHIHVDNISGREFFDIQSYAQQVLEKLGYYDRRNKVAKTLHTLIINNLAGEKTLRLTPEYFKEKILPLVRKKASSIYMEVIKGFRSWEESFKSEQARGRYSLSDVLGLLRDKIIVHIDLSATRDYNHAYRIVDNLLRKIYETALEDPGFGCIVAIDEAHLYAPEKGGVTLATDIDVKDSLKSTLHIIATTGPRNGVTPFIATQRPSLISKTITTQMGQNIIAHRVEDVDLARIMEIMGPIAKRVRVLPRGWAIAKGLAAKIREPIIIRIEAEAYPKSTGKTAYERFLGQ